MTVEELYEAAKVEYAEAEEDRNRNFMRASLGLQAFILILIERKKIFWDDDANVIRRVHHDIKLSSPAVKDKTNEMILDKMIDI